MIRRIPALLLLGAFSLPPAKAMDKSVAVTDASATYPLEFLTTEKGETHKITVTNGQTDAYSGLRNRFNTSSSTPWAYVSRESDNNKLIYKAVQVNHRKALTVSIDGRMLRPAPPPGGRRGAGAPRTNHDFAVNLPSATDVLVGTRTAPGRPAQNLKPLATAIRTVGIGEEVTLSVRNSHLGNPEWSVAEGDAVFKQATGDSDLQSPWTSTSNAYTVTVAVGLQNAAIRLRYPKSGTGPTEVRLTVVKPSGMTGVKLPESEWTYPAGVIGVSTAFDPAVFFAPPHEYGSFFNARVTATPSAVSYANVYFREVPTQAVGVTGDFVAVNGALGTGLPHNPPQTFTLFDDKNSWKDQIGLQSSKRSSGSGFRWDVPIELKLKHVTGPKDTIIRPESAIFRMTANGTPVVFPQTFLFTDDEGSVTVTKFGVTHTRKP